MKSATFSLFFFLRENRGNGSVAGKKVEGIRSRVTPLLLFLLLLRPYTHAPVDQREDGRRWNLLRRRKWKKKERGKREKKKRVFKRISGKRRVVAM